MAKVLGINTSHEASIAGMTDGKLDFYHEEARWARDKHYIPHEDTIKESGMLSLDWAFEQTPVDEWDTIGIASFDRRHASYQLMYEETDENDETHQIYPVLEEDRWLFQDLRRFLIDEPITEERVEQAQKDFKWDGDTQVFQFGLEPGHDMPINTAIADKYKIKEFDFVKEHHHLLHAFCGLYMSPFKEALVLVCDGGGARVFYEDYPSYGEIESIYYLDEQTVEPLYKHLTNNRDINSTVMSSIDQNFFCHDTQFDLSASDNKYGYDVRLSSLYSEGQKFSMLSQLCQLDSHGRAAGKLMGLASYGLNYPWDEYSHFGVAGKLQRETVNHTKELIQRALDYKPECKNIILSGGYALNCVGNYEYKKIFPNINIFIDPASHDGGTAIGSCVKNTFYMGDE